MRQTIIAAAAAFVIGGATTGAVLSVAQPAPPPPAADAPDGPRPGMAGGWHRGPWMHRHGMGRPAMQQGGPVGGMRAFALIYRQKDRALSPADVTKIAEAFLLWNGNHTWKVANAATTSDGLIAFDMTAPDGSVIAKFTMDPHTARLVRVG